MRYDNTNDKDRQVEDITNCERLVDARFPWVEKRRKAMDLAQIYEYAGNMEYANRAGSCGTFLKFNGMFDGSRTLAGANFCQLRLCPMCAARRAKKAEFKLSQVMNAVEAEHPGCRFLFLTLTIQNVPGSDLSAGLERLTKGWYRLMDQCAIERAIKGWFRAIETTRNFDDGTYHPHIHAILAVESEYFDKKSGLWITQEDWRKRWAKAARLDYDPWVHIRITSERKANDDDDSPSRPATVEAAKYATKDSEYIDPRLSLDLAAEIVTTYTNAVRRRRLTAYGGWMKEAAQRFGADNAEEDKDLVHIDDDHVRDDLADLVETYKWHFGAMDYILTSRELNPEKYQVDPATGEVIASGCPNAGRA